MTKDLENKLLIAKSIYGALIKKSNKFYLTADKKLLINIDNGCEIIEDNNLLALDYYKIIKEDLVLTIELHTDREEAILLDATGEVVHTFNKYIYFDSVVSYYLKDNKILVRFIYNSESNSKYERAFVFNLTTNKIEKKYKDIFNVVTDDYEILFIFKDNKTLKFYKRTEVIENVSH